MNETNKTEVSDIITPHDVVLDYEAKLHDTAIQLKLTLL
jgi:hypothetical protein